MYQILFISFICTINGKSNIIQIDIKKNKSNYLHNLFWCVIRFNSDMANIVVKFNLFESYNISKIQYYVTWKDIESFRYIIFRVFKFIYCLNGFPCHISDTQSDHPSHISSTPLTQNTMLDDSCLDQLLYDFGFFFWPTRYLPLREGRKGEIEGRKGMAFNAAADFSSLW